MSEKEVKNGMLAGSEMSVRMSCMRQMIVSQVSER
jgi:hypothetical protein